MRLRPHLRLLLLLAWASIAPAVHAASVDYGTDLQGKPVHDLAGPDAKVVVLFFAATDCPISNRYVPEIARLAHEFSSDGVRVWWVYPNADDTAAVVAKHNQEFGIAGDVILDAKQSLVALARVTVTPEAAVFIVMTGGGLREVYIGRVDDRYLTLGQERPQAQHHDLELAIAAAAGRKPVPSPEGRPVGCSIVFLQSGSREHGQRQIQPEGGDGKLSFFAKDRIEVETPSAPFKLAEVNDLGLKIRVPGLASLYTFQAVPDNNGERQIDRSDRKLITESVLELPILHRADGTLYLQIVPLRLGKIMLEMTGRYSDGGITNLTVMLDVELPSTPAKGIVVGRLGSMPQNDVLKLASYGVAGGWTKLQVGAKFDDMHGYLPLDNRMVSFEARTDPKAPAIEFDSALGAYRAVRPGDAAVFSRFEGFTNITCITVEGSTNSNSSRHYPCASLLSDEEQRTMREEMSVRR